MTSTIHADKIMNASGDQDSGVDLLVNDQVKLKTANTDRVTVTDSATTVSNNVIASSNVGIKTTSPSAVLHVDSDNAFGNIMMSRDGGVAGRRNFGLGVTGSTDEALYLTCSPDTNHANVFANTYKSVMGFNVGDTGAVRAFLQPLTVVRYSANTQAGAYNSGSSRNAAVCKPTDVQINQGSNFNTGTGQFTCPVGGTYRVAFMGNFYGNNISNYILIQIRKNGARVDQAYQKNLTTDWVHMIRVAYVTCAANDTLEIYNNADSGGGTKGGWDTHWYTQFAYSLVI
tara:strand:+ start:911 stop:1768 length:858 start_codon:yes stop_codon:yes gene_type:complete